MTLLNIVLSIGATIGIMGGLRMVHLSFKRATGAQTTKRDERIAELWTGIGALTIGVAAVLQPPNLPPPL